MGDPQPPLDGAFSRADTDPWLGRTVGGRFAVTSRIGRGGMGAVYVARQHVLDRDVALKVIRVDLADDPEVIARFEREARAIARLSHPNIVVVHDFGASDGALFLAMERLTGTPLGDRIRAVGRLDVATALRIIRDVVGALVCAHGNGVIHRDLKPDNIMLVDNDDRDDFAKVLDFGIAKVVGGAETALTASRLVLGTPGYVAPEVIVNGMTDDPRTDLYAVGVILFQMIAGRAPFQATVPAALLIEQVTLELPRLDSIVDGVPAAVVDLVARLTARRPDDRPASAREVLERLDRILGRRGSGLLRLDEIAAAAMTTQPFASPTVSTLQVSPPVSAPPVSTMSLSALVGGVRDAQPPAASASAPSEASSTSITAPARPRRGWIPLAVAAAASLLVGLTVTTALPRSPAPPVSPPTATLPPPAPPLPAPPPAPAATLPPPAPTAPPVEAAPNVATPASTPPPKPSPKPASKPSSKPTSKATPADPPPQQATPMATPTLPTLTSDLVRQGLAASFGKASACSNTNIKRAASGSGIWIDHCPSYRTVAGDHQVFLTLAPSGEVVGARFDDATATTSIGACVLASLRAWHFAPFAGSENVEINQRIVFEPCVPINGKCVF